MEANAEWINSTKVASSLMLLLFVHNLYKDKTIVSTVPGSSTCGARALSPASFLTGFPSDHHVVLWWLVEQRVPCLALSPASFLTGFPSDHHVVLWWLVEQRVPCLALSPASFLTGFPSDHHVVLWWLVEQRVSCLALSPASFLTSLQAFHLTTMWYCDDWWNRGFHA